MPRDWKDSIYLRNLQLSAVVGLDAWGRAGKLQPVVLSLRLCRDTLRAGETDEIKDTFSYGQMCKEVTASVDGKSFADVEAINGNIGRLSNAWAGETLECQVTLPKALLRVDGGLGRETVMQRYAANEWLLLSSQWTLRKIKTACIIGVNAHERLEKQGVNIDLCLSGEGARPDNSVNTSHGKQTWQSLVRMALNVSDFEC